MNYLLIGSGNIAWFLAQELSAGGHTCSGIYARNKSEGHRLAATYNVPFYESLSDLYDGPDACFLAVPDNAIAEVCSQLSFNSTVLIHTAGSADISLLNSAAKLYGVLWPVYSIRKENLPQHGQVPLVWEANNRLAARIIRILATTMSTIERELDGTQRKKLHLAAVMSNNFCNHLIALATSICREAGVPLSMLLPILQQTFAPEQMSYAASLQTGPAVRRDTATIEEHMALLALHPQWQEVYRAVTASIMQLYPEK